jgi:hypothetical protein
LDSYIDRLLDEAIDADAEIGESWEEVGIFGQQLQSLTKNIADALEITANVAAPEELSICRKVLEALKAVSSLTSKRLNG